MGGNRYELWSRPHVPRSPSATRPRSAFGGGPDRDTDGRRACQCGSGAADSGESGQGRGTATVGRPPWTESASLTDSATFAARCCRGPKPGARRRRTRAPAWPACCGLPTRCASTYHTPQVFAHVCALSVQVPAAQTKSTIAKLGALPGVTNVEVAARRYIESVPSDPGYASSQSAYLAAVNAPAAWDVQTGSAAVKIAIVDSGVDVTHPDLSGKIVGTYNAVDGTADVTDSLGHGTFVAGVAAAATNNDAGVAGAGYNTSLLAIKVADASDLITVDAEAAGIKWAADHGANVINISLGGPTTSSIEQNAIRYAQGKGALVVAAAGNDASTTRSYPAANPGVIAVGATDAAGHRAGFSNYGSWVTLGAPGVGIVSTTPPTGSSIFPAAAYGSGDGTSFSAPLVAGEAALLIAQKLPPPPQGCGRHWSPQRTATQGSGSGPARWISRERLVIWRRAPHPRSASLVTAASFPSRQRRRRPPLSSRSTRAHTAPRSSYLAAWPPTPGQRGALPTARTRCTRSTAPRTGNATHPPVRRTRCWPIQLRASPVQLQEQPSAADSRSLRRHRAVDCSSGSTVCDADSTRRAHTPWPRPVAH